jgi:hypothetical protein
LAPVSRRCHGLLSDARHWEESMRLISGAALPLLVGLAPAMAEPITVDRQANHPNGTVLIVRSVDSGEDATRLSVIVTTADREVALNRSNSMVLTDGAGAQYHLIPPAENDSVEIPAYSRMTGELVFSGRIRPDAERVVLSTNDGIGGSTDNRFTGLPVFRIELPLRSAPGAAQTMEGTDSAGATAATAALAPPAAGDARTFEVDQQVNHPNGTVLWVRSLETREDGMLVDLRVTTSDREIALNPNNSMLVVDERGARYRVVAPPDNPNLSVPPGTQIEGKVFFAGRLQPGVSRVTLLVNDGSGGQSRSTSRPEFRIEMLLGG